MIFLVDLSRYVIRGRGHGCTDIGGVAAATYGVRAWPFLLFGLAEPCWHEHPSR